MAFGSKSRDSEPRDPRPVVDALLADALDRGASDLHVEPVAGGYEVRYRIDGLLGARACHDAGEGRAIVGRLMVLAGLLTYRLDVPQEGRLTLRRGEVEHDLRLAIMPTAKGLRAVVRLPGELSRPRALAELGLPPAALAGCQAFAAADQGMLVVTGPAGAGKTTTLYALLGAIAAAAPGLSLITLEDPVERHLPGVTQIEVRPFGELTYERCLRSILRQDPQALMLGEIRDPATASLAMQAAMSGHRLLCTLHAAAPAGAIARLQEMGIEPYQITSSLFGVLAQRLLRRRLPAGGYAGRVPAAEFVALTPALRQAILARGDADALDAAIARSAAHVNLRASAQALVDAGLTDADESTRVLGPPPVPPAASGL